MARMTEDGLSSTAGPQVKQRVVRCPNCSIELNLPESVLGRRLKCPKCEAKFLAPAVGVIPSPSQFNADSSLYLPAKGLGSSGSQELPSFGSNGSGAVELPTSLAPLRETFDLPMLDDLDPTARPKAKAPAASGLADAAALFQDQPKSARKPKGAEARAQARRCSSCSSIVPAGMSLCSRCGLDLDTGQRHAPLEIYDDEMPVAPRAAMPPVALLAVGSLCSIGFATLSVASLLQWSRGVAGAEFLLVVWLFGLFGGVQFLRRKSIRPIFLGTSLAIAVGTVYLIAMPIYYANVPTIQAGESGDAIEIQTTRGYTEDIRIQSKVEALDMNRISWGVGSLLSYAALAVYLNSPGLRRQFRR